MEKTTVTSYDKVCASCGLSNGVLEYQGNGIFIHRKGCATPLKERKPPQILKNKKEWSDVTVPQCVCSVMYTLEQCPYYGKDEI